MEKVQVSEQQSQIIEKMLLVTIKKQFNESPWFWYEINDRSKHIWQMEQDARQILGKDIGVFMKDSLHNFNLLQKILSKDEKRYEYLLQWYAHYHAYVLDPVYALSVNCQIPAWVPVDNDEGATKKIMLFCVLQLYPRIFYAEHKQNIMWRKGGVLIEKMSYDDAQGIWFRTPEGMANAIKIELAWYAR